MAPARTYMEQLELKSRVDAVRAMHPELSIRAACAQAGVNHANYLRWTRIVESGGPKAPAKKGRPAKWTVSDADRNCLRWFMAWTESFALAAEYFEEYGRTGTAPLPNCPHPRPSTELCAQIAAEQRRGGRWDTRLPKLLRNAARLTKAERDYIRGQKAYNDGALSTRRLMVIRDFDPVTGLIQDIPMWAGCGFCSDDVSPEQPFTAIGEDGPRVNRQTLATHDIYSRRWLGLMCLGREGDAYTKVDQAEHIASIVRECGLPYYWSFERGPWANTFIDGLRVPSGWADEETVWGGLSGLFRVRHKFKPQHKTIEGAFSDLQRRMRGRSVSVGSRSRAENERATKIVTAAQRGNEEALRYLWNINDAAETIWQQMEGMNGREMRREFLEGAMARPNDLWELTYRPRPLAASDAWMLLPIKEARVITKQRISISLKGYGTFDFACVARGELPLMDNGHRLLVAFHPGRPEEGAQLFNGDTRAQYNRDGLRFGEHLGTARYLPAVPMEDFTGSGDYSAARRARQAVSSELRTAKASLGGVVKLSRRADPLGNALQIASGNAAPAPAPVPAPPVAAARSVFAHVPDTREPLAEAPEDESDALRPPADVWAQLTA